MVVAAVVAAAVVPGVVLPRSNLVNALTMYPSPDLTEYGLGVVTVRRLGVGLAENKELADVSRLPDSALAIDNPE